MLFGSAVVVAILLAGSTRESTAPPHRSQTHLWLEADVRPQPFDLTPKPPFEFKSGKICGANGFAAFVPIAGNFAVGAAFTTFRMSHTQRAAQFVFGIRFRF